MLNLQPTSLTPTIIHCVTRIIDRTLLRHSFQQFVSLKIDFAAALDVKCDFTSKLCFVLSLRQFSKRHVATDHNTSTTMGDDPGRSPQAKKNPGSPPRDSTTRSGRAFSVRRLMEKFCCAHLLSCN